MEGVRRLAGRRRRRCNIKLVQFYLFFNSALQSKSGKSSPRPPLILFVGEETIRIDGASYRRAAGEQGRKKASTAENEWLMSSVEKGKKKKAMSWMSKPIKHEPTNWWSPCLGISIGWRPVFADLLTRSLIYYDRVSGLSRINVRIVITPASNM